MYLKNEDGLLIRVFENRDDAFDISGARSSVRPLLVTSVKGCVYLCDMFGAFTFGPLTEEMVPSSARAIANGGSVQL